MSFGDKEKQDVHFYSWLQTEMVRREFTSKDLGEKMGSFSKGSSDLRRIVSYDVTEAMVDDVLNGNSRPGRQFLSKVAIAFGMLKKDVFWIWHGTWGEEQLSEGLRQGLQELSWKQLARIQAYIGYLMSGP